MNVLHSPPMFIHTESHWKWLSVPSLDFRRVFDLVSKIARCSRLRCVSIFATWYQAQFLPH